MSDLIETVISIVLNEIKLEYKGPWQINALI